MPAWRHFPPCALGDVHSTGSHGRLGKVGGGAGERAEGLHQKREGPAARAGEVRRVRVCCWGVHLYCHHCVCVVAHCVVSCKDRDGRHDRCRVTAL